jgi:hypothetical protein
MAVVYHNVLYREHDSHSLASFDPTTALRAAPSRRIDARGMLCITDSVISIRVPPPGHLDFRACAGT